MHSSVVDDFIVWCQNAFLKLNVLKTKEMTIDFRLRGKSIDDKQISITVFLDCLNTFLETKPHILKTVNTNP